MIRNTEPEQTEPNQRPQRVKNRLRIAFFLLMGGLFAIRLGGSLFSDKNRIGSKAPTGTASGQKPAQPRKAHPPVLQPPPPMGHSPQDITIRKKAGAADAPPVEAEKHANRESRRSGFKDGYLFTLTHVDRKLGPALKLDREDRVTIEKLRNDLLAQQAFFNELNDYKQTVEDEQEARKELAAAGVDVEKIKKALEKIRLARGRREALTGGFDAELSFLLGMEKILSKEQLDRIWPPRRQTRIKTRHMERDRVLDEKTKPKEREGREERKKRIRNTENGNEKE